LRELNYNKKGGAKSKNYRRKIFKLRKKLPPVEMWKTIKNRVSKRISKAKVKNCLMRP
jgi:hypothetical protein